MNFDTTIETLKIKYKKSLERYKTLTNSTYLTSNNLNQLKLLFNKCDAEFEFESIFKNLLNSEIETVNICNYNIFDQSYDLDDLDLNNYNDLNDCENFDDNNEEIISKKFIEQHNHFLEKYCNEIHEIQSQTIKKNKNKKIEDISNDDLIKMNLKMVIHLAKKYIKYADMDDLISAGNQGLCIACEKYKKNNTNKLVDLLCNEIKEIGGDNISQTTILNLIKKHITYGKLLNKLETRFSKKESYSSTEVCEIIKHTIPAAKFSSVAYMWIRAYILFEIKSSCIKNAKPTNIKYQDDITQFEKITNSTDSESFNSNLEIEKSQINKLLNKLPAQHHRILKMHYGIGYFEPISIKNIALKENLSTARVIQIIKKSIDDLKSMIAPTDSASLFE